MVRECLMRNIWLPLLLTAALLLTGLATNPHLHRVIAQEPDESPAFEEIIRMGHGTVRSASWSAGGDTLLVNSSQGIWIYDHDFEEQAHLPRFRAGVLSADDRRVAGIGVADGDVQVWDTSDYQTSSALNIQDYSGALAFDDSGMYLAGSGNNGVWIWRFDTGQVLDVLPVEFQVVSLAWSPDGQKIALGGVGAVAIWDLQSQTHLALDASNDDRLPYQVAWSPDSGRVATAISSNEAETANSLRIWNAENGDLLSTIQSGRVLSLAWNRTDGLLATGIGEYGGPDSRNASAVRIWNPSTGELVAAFTLPSGDILSIQWHSDGNQFLTASSDNLIRIWDFPEHPSRSHRILQGFSDGITSLSWNPDGIRIASSSNDGGIRIWNTDTGEALSTFQANQYRIWSVVWSPDGQQIVSGGDDYRVRLWQVQTGNGQELYSHQRWNHGVEPGVHAVVWGDASELFSIGSDQILNTYQNGRLDSIDVDASRSVRGAGLSVTWGSANRLLATFLYGAELWNVADRQQIGHYRCGEDSLITDGALSSDGRFVAVANYRNELCIWDIETHELLTTVSFTSPAVRLAWSNDGNHLAVLVQSPENAAQTLLHIIEPRSGETLEVITDHPDAQSLAWSPDDTRLATGGRDGIIHIWSR